VALTVKNANQELMTGGRWVVDVYVTDADDLSVPDTLAATVTDPSGTDSAATIEGLTSTGAYRFAVDVPTPGRWVAVVTGTNGVVAATAHVSDVVTGVQMPTVADLDNYLGTHSWSDDDLAEALEAEASNQRRVCRVPAAYPADLRSALLRRAQFHLAMKRVQLGVIPGDADRDTIRPGMDSEVRRFEKPYRKLPVG